MAISLMILSEFSLRNIRLSSLLIKEGKSDEDKDQKWYIGPKIVMKDHLINKVKDDKNHRKE